MFRPGQRFLTAIPGVQVLAPRVTSAAGYVLDGISNIAAAYSLRKLRTGYSGSAVLVRRSSDSTEQDIGFDSSGEFDSSAFSNFVGGGTGFVKTWYDQSGNGRDAAQATAGNQPSIVLSVLNSKPIVRFDGSNDRLIYAGSETVGAAFSVANWSGASTFPLFNGLLTGSNTTGNVGIGFIGNQSTTNLYNGSNITFFNKIRMNGSLSVDFSTMSTHKIVSGIADDSADSWGDIRIGTDRTFGRYWQGDIAECIVFSATLSASNHNTIGSNMAARFGLSWTTVT